MTTTLLLPHAGELRRISALPTKSALREGASLLEALAKNPAFLAAEIIPLLEEAKDREDWYVARRHEAEHGAYSLKIFVWPAGTGTKIHDHSSWGVYHCAWGTVLEERYERLDDRSRADHARLKKVWRSRWGRQDGASTVLPGDGGIHRVGNPGEGTAITVHLYGPRMGEVDGRDYDPYRDHVCDRREPLSVTPRGTLPAPSSDRHPRRPEGRRVPNTG